MTETEPKKYSRDSLMWAGFGIASIFLGIFVSMIHPLLIYFFIGGFVACFIQAFLHRKITPCSPSTTGEGK